MSLLVLGLSHHSAPLTVLERAALTPDQRATLARTLLGGESITEAVVVATCNRLEVYADSVTFHGAVTDIGAALAAVTGVPVADLRDHLYVHYEDRAVAHLFHVACGLDSMAVGEAEILGQLKVSLSSAQRARTIGPHLNALVQHAIRVGKRAHSETRIDDVSVSLVRAGIDRAEQRLGDLAHAHVAVIGAGAMSGLVVAAITRHTPASLTIVNRSLDRAQRLAESSGGTARPWRDLPDVLAASDLIITCTGATGHVIGHAAADAAQRSRARHPGSRGQVYLDLAMPRDVDAGVAAVDGVHVLWLTDLAGDTAQTNAPEIRDVTELVTGEVAAYLVDRSERTIAPTVAALRARAADVVATELAALDGRRPQLDEATRAEVRRTVNRVVDKLLHAPTVRVKKLGTAPAGDYARALRELFDLDPYDVVAVSAPPPDRTLP